jgi:hypothetical protein
MTGSPEVKDGDDPDNTFPASTRTSSRPAGPSRKPDLGVLGWRSAVAHPLLEVPM